MRILASQERDRVNRRNYGKVGFSKSPAMECGYGPALSSGRKSSLRVDGFLLVPVTEERVVLYLHGRGSAPCVPPGDLIASTSWRHSLLAPALSDDWLSLPFPNLVERVDQWLDSAVVAMGHSFGAWLLLSAAAERMKSAADIPPLCLLAPILGKAFNVETGIGYFAPREKQVRSALGFERGGAPESLRERIRFVFAADDNQTPAEDADEVRSLGYSVEIVQGGHSLDHPNARIRIEEILRGVAVS